MRPDPPHSEGPFPAHGPRREPLPEPVRSPLPPFEFRVDPDYEFIRQLQQRRTPFTIVFLAINIGIYLLMSLAGDPTDMRTLVAFGAKVNPLIDSGEIWRFVTPVFVHIGLLHLAFNSYALWIVGPQVERLYGSARFVLMYVATGVAGVWGSYAFNPQNISAGASGAIFGMFGVLFMFGFRNRHAVPAFLRRAIGRGVAPVIVLNLLIGFTIPVIDNAAHIGGLVSGLALAGVIRFEQPGTRTPMGYRLGQIAGLGVILAGFSAVAANFDPPGTTDDFVAAVNSAQRAFVDSTRAIERGDTDLGPATERLTQAIQAIRSAPSIDDESSRIMGELGDVLEAQFALIREVGSVAAPNARLIRDLEANPTRYQEQIRELNDWVRRAGEAFGLQITRDADNDA